jgi:hypothetical protein
MNHSNIREKVDSALDEVKKILDETRNPKFARDVDHRYEDKFHLANFLTNVALAAFLNTLEELGFGHEKLMELVEKSSGGVRSATLRFASEQSCNFQEEKSVEVDNGMQRTMEIKERKTGTNEMETTASLTSKVSTTVKEYWWTVDVKYECFVFFGSDPNSEKLLLFDRVSSCDLITTGTKEAPFPGHCRNVPIDVSLSWLIKNILVKGNECLCNFSIDRTLKSCRTPRRNESTLSSVDFFTKFENWCRLIDRYLKDDLEGKLGKYLSGFPSENPVTRPSLELISPDRVFVPVLALFEDPNPCSTINQTVDDQGSEHQDLPQTALSQKPSASSEADLSLLPRNKSLPLATIPGTSSYIRAPLLSIEDIDLLMKEQRRSLREEIASLENYFPSPDKNVVLSSAEAKICLCSLHLSTIASRFTTELDSIEDVLKSQLVDAIGKHLDPEDFSKYMRFHNSKLFKTEYSPVPFCYSVRQPDHYPDGTFSICSNGEAIETIRRKVDRSDAIKLSINAATTVEFTGDCFLHAWITHSFGHKGMKCSPQPQYNLDLSIRARQFSSMLVVIGKISGPNTFDPAAAVIVQNKDELNIPLLLEQLPTSKEFKDAIASLSPVQQRFAKAFRSMQLESSVFGICVVQLKPQLERLLNLPPDSLQKEIKLTQSLLELFIEYQIPSDLVTFSGDANATTAEKIAAVEGYVNAVRTMIDESKKKQLAEEKMEADMRFEMGYQPTPQRAAYFQRMAMAPLSRSSMQGPSRSMSVALQKDSFSKSISAKQQASQGQAIPPTKATIRTKVNEGQALDLSTIPLQLDAKFDEFDEDSALHPTTIKAGDNWTRKFYKNLLCKASVETIEKQRQEHEKNKAFELLDALSRSGSLPLLSTEIHAIVGATHCFDLNIMDTVIQENINPVDRFERSLLIVASTIYGIADVGALLKGDEQSLRISKHSPKLLSIPDSAQSIERSLSFQE